MSEYSLDPRSERIHGLQYVNKLTDQLRDFSPEEAGFDNASYAQYLAALIAHLPNSIEAWQTEGVAVTTGEDAVRIQQESTLRVFDYVAEQPDEGLVQPFLGALDEAISNPEPEPEQSAPSIAALLDADMLSTIFARTHNRPENSPQAKQIIGQWAAVKLSDEDLRRAVDLLQPLSRQNLSDAPATYDERIVRMAQDVTKARHAATQERQLENLQSNTKWDVRQERRTYEREEGYRLEDEAAKTLMRAADAEDFWAGYVRFREYFPADADFPQAEPARQARLFESWRLKHIQAKELAIADAFLNEQRPSLELNTIEGCDIVVQYEPRGFAIFPDIGSLTAAMDDFYTPRNHEGGLLEGYFTHRAADNKEMVDKLLQAARAWAADDNAAELFKDPMHDAARGGRGDILDYRGTALANTEIEVSRQPDGTLALNQLNVGIYANAPLTFGREAKIAYELNIPGERPDDTQILRTLQGMTATLRIIDEVPAEAIASHIRNVLEPMDADAVPTLREAIVRPLLPYHHYKPSAVVAVGDALIGFRPDFHNPHYRGYLEPGENGAYQSVRALIYEDGRAIPPEVEVTFRQLNAQQGAVVWAISKKTAANRRQQQ